MPAVLGSDIVIVFRFTRGDHLALRFAISPLFELLCAAGLLQSGSIGEDYIPWADAARERLANVEVSMLSALLNEDGYTPDFFTPPPTSTVGNVEGDLETVRHTPAEQLRRELRWRFPDGEIPDAVRLLWEDPDAGLARLVGEVREFWNAAIASEWPTILATAQRDIAYRARRLAERGSGSVFDDLAPDLEWRDGDLHWRRPHDQVVDLDGRGLLMMPVTFHWPGLSGLLDHRWQQPAVIYRPRGVAMLFRSDAPSTSGHLAELLGRRRSEILAALDEPATTSQLALDLGTAVSNVSEHLGVLRRSGLVTGQRDGMRVYYSRTELGDQLVRDLA